jgi:UDP-3-O-[3-hydroxymyristoyl] glucosamine N-acyltransferase
VTPSTANAIDPGVRRSSPGGGHTAGSLAKLLSAAGVSAELIGEGGVAVDRFESSERGGAGVVTFLRSEAFVRRWLKGPACVALLGRELVGLALPEGAEKLGAGRCLLVVRDVDEAASVVLGLFAPPPRARRVGVHPSAVVDAHASVAPDAEIGPHCVVESGARVGAGTTLVSGVHVGRDAVVGERTLLHPGVCVLDRCRVGSDCILHSGVVVGADGFGYRPGSAGLHKIPHIGDVVIEDGVEIGANSCVDRAKFGSTLIGSGTKIDNLCQIAHNCRVGKHCVLCGHVGLAGSVVLGDGVVLGGMVGVADGVEIGAGAQVGAHSGVSNDIPAGAVYLGTPAGPISEWRRNYAVIGKLGRTIAEIKKALRARGRE